MTFSEKLRNLRAEAGLTQEALADAVHVSRSAIAKYENGNGVPSEETLAALAFYFGVSADSLKDDKVLARGRRKKKWIIGGVVTGSALAIAAAVLVPILVLNAKAPCETPPCIIIHSVIGASAALSVHDNSGLDVPYVYHNADASYRYEVDYHHDYELLFRPVYEGEGKGWYVGFPGDCARFETQDFVEIAFDDTQQEAQYILHFLKEGAYSLYYHVQEYDGHIDLLVSSFGKLA